MKFEKLSENKIRITLTVNDLKEKDINFHDFMSNPLESQDIFLDILKEAKEKIGFNTTDYKVKIEALAMIDGDFIVNITRMLENEKISSNSILGKKKFKVRRKNLTPKSNQAIYKFESFLSQNGLNNSYLISKKCVVYMYENAYYLIFSNINEKYSSLLKFYSSITEFATYINNSTLFISKLYECGRIVIKNNALKISLNHFQKV